MRERLAYGRIGVLGPLEVAVGGVPVEIAGGRLRALLVRLALDPGRYVGTALLADGLWGDDAPADPGNALQSLVSRLRRALGRADVLAYGPAGYRLALPPEAVDAVRFERQAHAGREALAAGDAVAARRLLEEALALWRGPALADVADAPFAAAPAHRLEELRLEATEDRIEAGLAEGGPGGARPGAAVPELEALTVAHPLRERPRALLMRALYATGRQPEALGAYEEYRALLAEELGADPSEALRELHVAVLRGEAPGRRGGGGPIGTRRGGEGDPYGTKPAGASGSYGTRPGATGGPYRTKPDPSTGPGAPGAPPPPVRTSLRAALTSFVGRDDELRRVRALLGGSRLVTLTGPGGAGKTRLATTAAEALLGDSPGGVWLVELAPVTGGDDVPFAVLGALGQRETAVLDNRHLPPRDVLTRLTDTLAAAPTTLVLDNCEHVVSAAVHLADHLLRRCPELRVLATSREPLGIDGEALCPVPPPSLPPQDTHDARDGRDEQATGAAVRLFADRARAARPDFAVGPANAAAVAEICRRLDGLPLAIELAAARLRSLPVEQVAARLDNRFRLLTTGSRTALPRHRTLQAVVAWSWELLGDEERRLAEWLSVFPGGATPESVAGVCGMDVVTALDLLAALADKSLLQITEAPQGANAEPSAGPRYRMLETSASSVATASPRPATSTAYGPRTPRTSSGSPRPRTRTCAATSSSAGSPCSTPSTTTSSRPCATPSTPGTPAPPSGWSPPSASTG
ncbi:AAA family ATPase [Streptomyces sp. NBC_01808]|uniref:AfsR/SARP family transcriptional regulator n=1 Tax=Streptomyces sp. NBC_01808 TaxID=2975947 RepID=UPI002DD9502B|nr:BTAD domain-containing putative transcriptional regulator [Streptomyces sp. NBC_01808]WSA38747.1 AAA family ATPase [Streptomyces sp. NBC_01808]